MNAVNSKLLRLISDPLLQFYGNLETYDRWDVNTSCHLLILWIFFLFQWDCPRPGPGLDDWVQLKSPGSQGASLLSIWVIRVKITVIWIFVLRKPIKDTFWVFAFWSSSGSPDFGSSSTGPGRWDIWFRKTFGIAVLGKIGCTSRCWYWVIIRRYACYRVSSFKSFFDLLTHLSVARILALKGFWILSPRFPLFKWRTNIILIPADSWIWPCRSRWKAFSCLIEGESICEVSRNTFVLLILKR